ncbi:DUF1610 domain-containing protein [Clostridiaceae bacterium NSJ-31]|uniref:DUF1610 domain-containing protein n=1 Tax=Ligaoa zhengdingensis TaxID=2763658 RepID=A0A926DZC1_9FIRM|nr:DUF1610 domain-containing protein [Ligaoa zhengdingensis]
MPLEKSTFICPNCGVN